MVRAGVIKHPADWAWSGYHEIQSPPGRYRVIDQQELIKLLDITQYGQLQQHHKEQVENMLASVHHDRDPRWLSSIAVGSREYVDSIKHELGISGKYRHTAEENGSCVLREALVLHIAFRRRKGVSKPCQRLLFEGMTSAINGLGWSDPDDGYFRHIQPQVSGIDIQGGGVVILLILSVPLWFLLMTLLPKL